MFAQSVTAASSPQETTTGTPYQPLAVTLPNMMNHVHGVRKVRRAHVQPYTGMARSA
jgi:hypothetical protein